jgi:hypothetical protein
MENCKLSTHSQEVIRDLAEKVACNKETKNNALREIEKWFAQDDIEIASDLFSLFLEQEQELAAYWQSIEGLLSGSEEIPLHHYLSAGERENIELLSVSEYRHTVFVLQYQYSAKEIVNYWPEYEECRDDGYSFEDVAELLDRNYGGARFSAIKYFLQYQSLITRWSVEPVDAFVLNNGLEDLDSFEDSYCGFYDPTSCVCRSREHCRVCSGSGRSSLLAYAEESFWECGPLCGLDRKTRQAVESFIDYHSFAYDLSCEGYWSSEDGHVFRPY